MLLRSMEMKEFDEEATESEIKKQLKKILQSMIFARMPDNIFSFIINAIYIWI